MRGPIPVSRSIRPPLWREARFGLEAAALARDSVFRGEGVADGRGQPVLLIPGFLAGDGSLALMANWLRRTGHRPSKAGIRSNVDCSAAVVGRLEERLERLVSEQGRRAAIVGQSRGGCLAKVLAVKRPDLVAGIVTLGTPHVDPLAVHPVVRLQLRAVAALGTLGAPGLFKRTCIEGDCCVAFWEALAGKLPAGVASVSVYSRSDGIVDWRACLDPYADRHVEIDASHCGMAVNPAAWRAIADALHDLRRARARAAVRAYAWPGRPSRRGQSQGTTTAAPPHVAGAQPPERRIGALEGVGLDLRPDRDLRSQREELLAVGAGQVRHGAQRAFAPQQLVGKARDVAHVDTGANHRAPAGDRTQGGRHELARRGEDQRGVELLRRRTERVAGPLGAKRERERWAASSSARVKANTLRPWPLATWQTMWRRRPKP